MPKPFAILTQSLPRPAEPMAVAEHGNHPLGAFLSIWRRQAIQMCAAAAINLREIANESCFQLWGLMTANCRHSRRGWPRHGRQTCINCGQSWEYDWHTMQLRYSKPHLLHLHFRQNSLHVG